LCYPAGKNKIQYSQYLEQIKLLFFFWKIT